MEVEFQKVSQLCFLSFSGHLDVNSGMFMGLKHRHSKKKYKMKENYGQKGKTGNL